MLGRWRWSWPFRALGPTGFDAGGCAAAFAGAAIDSRPPLVPVCAAFFGPCAACALQGAGSPARAALASEHQLHPCKCNGSLGAAVCVEGRCRYRSKPWRHASERSLHLPISTPFATQRCCMGQVIAAAGAGRLLGGHWRHDWAFQSVLLQIDQQDVSFCICSTWPLAYHGAGVGQGNCTLQVGSSSSSSREDNGTPLWRSLEHPGLLLQAIAQMQRLFS
jgi:hypothetical protein